MRDDQWLLSRLDFLWSNHFADVPQLNAVFIRFGKFARLRFGSIKMDPSTSSFDKLRTSLRASHFGKIAPPKTLITITAMFKDETVPKEVVDHTIAHELCHYAHGFSSPHTKLHRYPHEGGIIKKEMENRGLIYLYEAYRLWVKGYREQLKEHYRSKSIKSLYKKKVYKSNFLFFRKKR